MENNRNQLGKNSSSGEEKVERIVKENAEEKGERKKSAKKTGGAKSARVTKGETAKKGGGKSVENSAAKAKERSAAKKRVELALKKEERKAAKQKAAAERKKRRAAAKEERRKKRLESKERRKEKRLEMHEKRAEAKRAGKKRAAERKERATERAAERKAAKQKRRAEKEKRRAALKAETKEARAKRLQKEKEAKIAARKEKKKHRYELRLQRRDAALKRKQRRFEEKQRRRGENHAPGFGGWLAAVISLGVVTLALGTIVTVGAVRMTAADGALSAQYRGALYELSGTLSEADDDLAKARVSAGGKAQSDALTDLLLQARLAESTLEKFPVDGETDVNMTAFLNRAGDAALRMLDKIRSGEKLSDADYRVLDELYTVNRKVLEELSALSDELTDKEMSAFMRNKAGNKVYERLRNIENLTIENALPFEKPVFYEGGVARTAGERTAISTARAEEACRKYFAEYDISSVDYAGETTSSEIDGYNFVMTDSKGTRLYAVISKADGALVGFDYYADCSSRNIDFENALQIAENYLQFLGYENMTAVWASESGVNATFTFVYEEDGVAYYPEAVRVKVCEERGKAVGLTAVSYLKHHARRPQVRDIEVVVSAEEAEQRLNGRLSANNVRKAVIPLKGRPALCYEFICSDGEGEYFVYVDTHTGEEVKINRVLPTTQGRYLR